MRIRLRRAGARRQSRQSRNATIARRIATLGAVAFWPIAFAAACHAPSPRRADGPNAARPVTSEGAIFAHVRALSSDELEGRAPGTHGEDLATAYIARELERIGLRAPFGEKKYMQDVPLVGITSLPRVAFRFGEREAERDATLVPAFPDDYVAISRRVTPKIDIENSEVVFVGYGVKAPELDWDDFKGADLRGKTLVMLIGDPPVPDPSDPSRLDPNVFGGSAMTYYGRWTYKYEIASKLGAAAALIVHDTAAAGYPYGVVRGWGRENFDIDAPGGNGARVALEGWLSAETAAALFAKAGHDLTALTKAAATRAFAPVPLNVRMGASVSNTLRTFSSHNVVGVLDGASSNREAVVYAAHWDHLGRDAHARAGTKDVISNGAVDNASGVAEVLEIARTLEARAPHPARSFVFLFPTAEESGLLGARYYVAQPIVPLDATLAEINLDMMNMWGRTRSIVSIAHGRSSLDALLAAAAAAQGRGVKPDPEPEKGYFYRSDNFEFAKVGVPALSFLRPGADYIGKPEGFDRVKAAEFIANDYHKASDEIKPDWDLAGAVDDVELLTAVGLELDKVARYPEWTRGSEFSRSSK